jgi:hypothetical protein
MASYSKGKCVDLKDPIALLIELQKILEPDEARFMAYGGLSLSLFGAPRFTRDADLAVSAAEIEGISQKIQVAFPLHHKALDAQPYGGLFITRFTLLGDGDKDDFNSVDLVFPRDKAYAIRALSRQMIGNLRDVKINIISPEDFVIFKVLSTRDIDLEDARRVLSSLGGSLDRELIESEIESLSQTTPDHPVLKRWQMISATH